MTTSTFYGNEADGYVRNARNNYSDMRSGVTGVKTVNFEGTGDIYPGQMSVDVWDTKYQEWNHVTWHGREGFLAFDTSSIGDSDTITVATLSLYFTNTYDLTVLEIRPDLWLGGGLNTNDYFSGANLSGLALLASKASGAITTGQYNDLTSESAFLSNISKTGNTELSATVSNFRLAEVPGQNVNQSVRFYASDQAGTTTDPKLVVTHNPASVPPVLKMSGNVRLSASNNRLRVQTI